MNWIETLFGVDPDLGTGSLETLIAAALIFVAVGLLVSRPVWRRGRTR